MTKRGLDSLFNPAAIALIGAGSHPHSVGAVTAHNLLAGGFAGPVMPVNPHAAAIQSVTAYPDIAALPHVPELAVIATPPAALPATLRELAHQGCRAAVVLTALPPGDEGRRLRAAMRAAIAGHPLRLVGPNCLGVLAPHRGINASFAHLAPRPGRIAGVLQSGAVAAAVLDWAAARGIGFSKLVSLGDMVDVDFGDMLDYLATDPDTDSILLYIEGVTQARKFMSAARAAARVKPVVVIKAGRSAAAARAAASHTGALAGADAVYDAAFRRAGLLRVADLDQLFAAVETLAFRRPLSGERLAVVTNGGGIGVLVTDTLVEQGGRLATLADATIQRLNAVLPATWSGANPVDIIGDAPGERYRAALAAVMADPGVDAVLAVNCPTAVASSAEAADGVIAAVRDAGRQRPLVLACWLGDVSAAAARVRLNEAELPTYATPTEAVSGFLHLARFHHNQAELLEMPGTEPEPPALDGGAIRSLIAATRAAGRDWMDSADARLVLQACGIPIAAAIKAADPGAVEAAARGLDGPVAVKILSPDITHKSDVGGVALHLASPADARAAAQAMQHRIALARPEARLEGFTVEPMIGRPGAPGAYELIAGLVSDPTFGPVILFGAGGTAVEVVNDKALALPPLNRTLARALIAQTRIAGLLAGYRDRPPADLAAIAEVLVRLAQLAADHPEIAELDINPLLADADGVIAIDARIRLQPPAVAIPMAIRPYPGDLACRIETRSGRHYRLRPIRPDDADALLDLTAHLTPEDIHARFLGSFRSLPRPLLCQLTQIDYDRQMALIAFAEDGPDAGAACGVVRLAADPDFGSAEYAVTVRSDHQGGGLGFALMQAIIAYARDRGIGALRGEVLVANHRMLDMARQLGFTVSAGDDPAIERVTLALAP